MWRDTIWRSILFQFTMVVPVAVFFLPEKECQRIEVFFCSYDHDSVARHQFLFRVRHNEILASPQARYYELRRACFLYVVYRMAFYSRVGYLEVATYVWSAWLSSRGFKSSGFVKNFRSIMITKITPTTPIGYVTAIPTPRHRPGIPSCFNSSVARPREPA